MVHVKCAKNLLDIPCLWKSQDIFHFVCYNSRPKDLLSSAQINSFLFSLLISSMLDLAMSLSFTYNNRMQKNIRVAPTIEIAAMILHTRRVLQSVMKLSHLLYHCHRAFFRLYKIFLFQFGNKIFLLYTMRILLANTYISSSKLTWKNVDFTCGCLRCKFSLATIHIIIELLCSLRLRRKYLNNKYQIFVHNL